MSNDTTTITPARARALLKRHAARPLAHGAHSSPDNGFCVMEKGWLIARSRGLLPADEQWSDTPSCVSRVIGALLRSWNDTLGDDARQMLAPYAERALGTAATPEIEQQRRHMMLDWYIRVQTPAWLRRAGLTAQADLIEALPALMDDAALSDALPTLRTIARDADEHESAAGSAAESAAGSAVRSAVRSAAGSAVRSAVWSAAESAAESAVWSAAESAVWSAVWSAAEAVLAPTVAELQQSALALLDRMIALSASSEPTGGAQ